MWLCQFTTSIYLCYSSFNTVCPLPPLRLGCLLWTIFQWILDLKHIEMIIKRTDYLLHNWFANSWPVNHPAKWKPPDDHYPPCESTISVIYCSWLFLIVPDFSWLFLTTVIPVIYQPVTAPILLLLVVMVWTAAVMVVVGVLVWTAPVMGLVLWTAAVMVVVVVV